MDLLFSVLSLRASRDLYFYISIFLLYFRVLNIEHLINKYICSFRYCHRELKNKLQFLLKKKKGRENCSPTP